MLPYSIRQLHRQLSETLGEVAVRETHISWIILCPNVVYKIPKPVQLPYLDFSTLAKRRHYCEQEVVLNQSLAGDMYQAVVPIYREGEKINLQTGTGQASEYAVKMKRMPASRLMSTMLKRRQVAYEHVKAIADALVPFHQQADLQVQAPDIRQMRQNFADILSTKSIIKKVLGYHYADQLEEWVLSAHRFLALHESRIMERYQQQYYRALHGDLHAENIFLMEQPVIFDCIAFNDDFRYGDLLDELAFFCMDMDFYDQSNLGQYFLQQYLLQNPCMDTEEDEQLLLFYKLYRANIRLKVNALKWQQADSVENERKHVVAMLKYYELMRSYNKTLTQQVAHESVSSTTLR